MPRLGNLDFDDRVLDALKDDKLVVFAGAGVSMGPPSNLDGFWRLAEKIARSTGLTPTAPLDVFLGTVQHKGVAIHDRAVELLSIPDSAPTDLHRDLIRLFGAADRVKVVTTNFDLHFETAARDLFGVVPDTYRAPALPLGYAFNGIVHVHGALPHARSVVLSDADFGRAYLTEGWARRFLVDLFSSHSVLFVGYSHDDMVMKYLARALPGGGPTRFALTEIEANWDLLGIRPIRFVKGEGQDAFRELYDGVAKLAERGARGTLDWQARIVELVGRAPPVDPELIGEIEQALREVPTCRFFTNIARDVGWPRWLDGRGHLEVLFRPGELSERDQLLAIWLARNYAIEHFDELFELVAAHGLQINPGLWFAIGRELGVEKGKPIENATLQRWITVLIASAPLHSDRHVWMWLAERCHAQGLVTSTLGLFLQMCKHKFELKRGFAWRDSEEEEERTRLDAECTLVSDHWSLNSVWENRIRPHLNDVAQPLLSELTRQLENMQAELASWSGAMSDWDSTSYRRSAIEPHEQNRYTEAADVLIDAARDALEWFGMNSPPQFDAWIERLITSPMPLLRRLAVHAMSSHPNRAAEERLAWVLDRVGVRTLPEHHEVHRLAALNYPSAGDNSRRAFIDAVIATTFSDTADVSGEVRAARFQFDWLSWLLTAKTDCTIAEAALAPIRERFQEWRASEHPDLTHWTGSGWVGSESPWSTDQLLSRPAAEQFDALIEFQGSGFNGPSREGLLSAVRDAAKRDSEWAIGLAAELRARALWPSDLWQAVLRGLQDAPLGVEQWRRVLEIAALDALHPAHARDIADVLYSLVKDGGRPFATELLPEANAIAERLWAAVGHTDDADFDDDWLTRAINRPAGVLIEYWLGALTLALKGKEGTERTLPDYYRDRFTAAVQDASSNGAYARALLASQSAYLFRVDEGWTREHLLPLFQHPDRRVFAQAWHGFLAWGRLYPDLIDALLPAFIEAIARAQTDLPEHCERLIEFYAALSAFHVADPLEQLLPALFQHVRPEDRTTFASQIEHLLRQMNPAPIGTLWNAWLSRYWHDRLQGVFAPLEPGEIRQMLEWLPHLGEAFPAAVALATQMPAPPRDYSHLLLDLRESDLVDRFPESTASLLIYLAGSLLAYQAADLAQLATRIRNIPEPLRRRLNEALARAGAT